METFDRMSRKFQHIYACKNLSTIFERHRFLLVLLRPLNHLLGTEEQLSIVVYVVLIPIGVTNTSSIMLGPIGNDILDIGSRKATMARAAAHAADPLGFGRPGQFEVPNVTDVRSLL